MPRNLGFSLLEILIAIAVLSIATAIAIPNLRKFNEDQSLTNSKGDLVRSIRQAQSNAQSGVLCTSNGQTSVSWGVKFTAAANATQYYIVADCKAADGITITTGVMQKTISPDAVTVGATCSITPPLYPVFLSFASTTFASSTVNFPCPINETLKVILKSTRTNQYQCVTIEKGGAIYDATSCP